jgi:hypothetical protein
MSPPAASALEAPKPRLSAQAASLLVVVTTVTFVLLISVAMILYTGGTWLDPHTSGHDFFRNFFCDLTALEALNGQQNPGALFAKAGMMIFTVGFAPFWLLVAKVFAHAFARLSKVVQALGILSTAAAVLVPLVSSQQYGFLHPLLIFLAGVPGLLAGGFATYALATTKTETRVPARLAVLTVALVAIDGALYAAHVISGQAISSALLPGLQKFAALSLVAWMLSTARVASKIPNRAS